MRSMVFCRRRLVLVVVVVSSLVGAAAASGCADTDPHYGPPEAIRGRSIDFGDAGSSGTVTPTAEGGAQPTAARAAFDKLYASFNPTCSGCHAPNGIGSVKFSPPSKDESYKIFQDQNYKNLTRTPPGFYNKGSHSGGGGPALTAAQQALTQTWSTAESAGGTTTPTDAGGD